MRLRFTNKAKDDLEEIADDIADDNPSRADTFVADLRARCRGLLILPYAVPVRPEIAAGMRVVVHRNYLLFYVVQDNAVVIRRVLYGARDISADLFEIS